MKKILIPAMALMLSVSAFAMKVGYVNSQEAFAKFSQTKTVQENLNKEKTRLENEIKQNTYNIDYGIGFVCDIFWCRQFDIPTIFG